MLVPNSHVSLLILGAGWTSTFLIPLLEKENITYAATTTNGRDDTIKFRFDPVTASEEQFRALPAATTVLITFPIKGEPAMHMLAALYEATHSSSSGNDARASTHVNWIQLGSTGIWQIPDQPLWIDRQSRYDVQNERAQAEDHLMTAFNGCALNLAGLWGGHRQPRDWLSRVAKSKQELAGKGSLHLVHGADVAQAIVALHKDFTPGQRWMLTDMFVYDWWSLAIGWGGAESEEDQGIDGMAKGEHATWVRELMSEKDVKALPRSMEMLGRCYDTREFWNRFKITPVRARIE